MVSFGPDFGFQAQDKAENLDEDESLSESPSAALTENPIVASDDDVQDQGNTDRRNISNINQENNSGNVQELKSQLNTLMQSLATLSEEKSRMEAGFQADKRFLRNEKEEVTFC